MKFGVCCGADRFEIVKKAGYDYIEGFLSEVSKMDAMTFADYREKLQKTGLQAETFNGFFFGDIVLVGENVDFDRIREYTARALQRAASLGGKIAVIGSGKARNVPEGFDRKTAEEQFLKVLDICGTIAAENGMAVAIEPLNANETNLINTVAEGKDFAARCGNAHVGCLADFFHVFMSGEDLSAVEDTAQPLLHVHLARANADRRMPVPGEDDAMVARWAKALKAAGYDARISLEGSFRPDFETVITGLRPLLEQFR